MRTLSIFLLIVLSAIFIDIVSAEECKEGDTKQEQCNTCKCTTGGWACTKRHCTGKREECKEGDTKQEQCNTCKCTTGGWACTKRHCTGKRATYCNPGERFKMDCNTCVCAPNGQNAACTLKACGK